MIFHARVDTAWGPCWLEWNQHGLLRSYLPGPCQPAGEPAPLPDWLEPCAGWLVDFYLGKRPAEVDFRPVQSQCGQADWQVYEHTRAIPPGQVLSYGQIARLCGRPGAAQWVGQVLGSNPWPPFVPCHRVVGARGKMVGFSGPGGVDSKRRMLDMELGREQGELFAGS
ncbi:MAG: MGMT family protein [Vulcanimicrobiota bacterium]